VDLTALPRLGLGLSCEHDSARRGLDAVEVHDDHPELFDFLEVGADLLRGLDPHMLRWAARGWPTTYHFLDLNLEEPEDIDELWVEQTRSAARSLNAAWLCGDGGLWHFGPRDRAQLTLMPPVLDAASARDMAEAVRRVQAATGMTCLPENPPATVYLGDLHVLEYFARMAEDADCGLLLDCAHLAIFQHSRGHAALDGLDAYPLERVVELHVAGGSLRDHQGLAWIDDDHGPEPLPDTWKIVEHVAARAPNLKAVVYECERTTLPEVVDTFTRLRALAPVPGQ
jgi:uncharacterized protein (UPF0276 family)